MLGGLDTDVGGKQHGFQFFEQRLINLGANAEQAGDLAGEGAARARKSLLEALRPGLAWGFCGRSGFGGGRGVNQGVDDDRGGVGFARFEETKHEMGKSEAAL